MEILVLIYFIIGFITALVHVRLVYVIGHGWSVVGPVNFTLSAIFWPYTIGAWIYYFTRR